jgi:regulation of enolase protein 1 (concanavalin A-like superfamily)
MAAGGGEGVDPVVLGGLPMTLHWLRPPLRWEAGDRLRIAAGPGTDLFADPRGEPARDNAPCLLGPAAGDWALAARVSVEFAAAFDAGVLVVREHAGSWAKLCFESSPAGRPTVVTVVNRGVSDDANAFTVDGAGIWLRVARIAPAWAFHASTDGRRWQLVRYFALDPPGGGDLPRVGFSAQSPTGRGCTATFDDIGWSAAPPADIRGGD